MPKKLRRVASHKDSKIDEMDELMFRVIQASLNLDIIKVQSLVFLLAENLEKNKRKDTARYFRALLQESLEPGSFIKVT